MRLKSFTLFQLELIQINGPVYYAVEDERVVGWCDIFPGSNARQSHRGGLGMGLLPEVRRRGLGSKLLSSTLEHAKRFGLEKIELQVKFGFHEEGVIKKYRKLDGNYFDSIMMAKFL